MSCAVKTELNCRNTTPLSWTGDYDTIATTFKDLKIVIRNKTYQQNRLKNIIVITFYSKPSCLYSRPYSQNLPSLHALKDWCDWSDVTWFLGVAVAVARSCLFIPYNRKFITFHLRDDNGKLWVEAIIVTSLDAVATVDVAGIQNIWSQVTGQKCRTLLYWFITEIGSFL